jgi:predicted ribosomally synthesized peptide with SipW-like signal peptide
MNKKSIGALLLSAALFVGATGATFAYFTDLQKTDVQSITLGNLHVAFQPANGNANWDVIGRAVPNYLDAAKIDLKSALDLINDNGYNEIVKADKNHIANVAPGDVLRKTFTLKNTGTLDAKVKLSLADVNNTTTSVPGGNYLFKAYTLNVDGTPGNDVIVTVDADHPGSFVLDAKSNESIVVYTMVYLDSSIKNGGMDKNLSFDVQVDATQWNNPGWNQ